MCEGVVCLWAPFHQLNLLVVPLCCFGFRAPADVPCHPRRAAMKAWARQQFNWDRTADLWSARIQQDLARRPSVDVTEVMSAAIPQPWRDVIEA